ncbi:hypothetical protein IMF23_03700 [Chelatococcus daeguensis]|uniref:Uncharacterized protein n=1 Tax=Chelatococcus caeni TaxID=1348468 RepID=A0A840C1P3_9HYPH|nr:MULTISPECIES: hypothetical protein [Chelatococcus]MBB4016886.1 hypothetical protein [Chelatococcus caeni]MBM3082537.1 hypothetical protein [Chelatococcus daeguensis]
MAVSESVAVNFWIERVKGRKIREICAAYDVDPRRLYEVFAGQVHPSSLDKARRELEEHSPSLLNSPKLRFHQPTRQVVKRASDLQYDLFTGANR